MIVYCFLLYNHLLTLAVQLDLLCLMLCYLTVNPVLVLFQDGIMKTSSRQCLINENIFCYICRSHVITKRPHITRSVKQIYFVYFGIHTEDEGKRWATRVVLKRL